MNDPVLDVRDLRRSFQQGGVSIDVLRGVDLTVARGEIVALLGPSGSGKSTMLQAVGLLEGGFTGAITIDGQRVEALDAAARTAVRRDKLGFVYQFHHLLPEFTALDNVALPLMIAGKTRTAARERAGVLLSELGLAARLDHQPAQMSGGEQQRVAVARALANSPRLLLADEPTGNLDPSTSGAVFENLYALARKTGVAALVATHNLDLARHMDRVFALKDGHLEEQPKG